MKQLTQKLKTGKMHVLEVPVPDLRSGMILVRDFYYQKTRWYTNKIPYIRWSQAWMFYALSKLSHELTRIIPDKDRKKISEN